MLCTWFNVFLAFHTFVGKECNFLMWLRLRRTCFNLYFLRGVRYCNDIWLLVGVSLIALQVSYHRLLSASQWGTEWKSLFLNKYSFSCEGGGTTLSCLASALLHLAGHHFDLLTLKTYKFSMKELNVFFVFLDWKLLCPSKEQASVFHPGCQRSCLAYLLSAYSCWNVSFKVRLIMSFTW